MKTTLEAQATTAEDFMARSKDEQLHKEYSNLLTRHINLLLGYRRLVTDHIQLKGQFDNLLAVNNNILNDKLKEGYCKSSNQSEEEARESISQLKSHERWLKSTIKEDRPLDTSEVSHRALLVQHVKLKEKYNILRATLNALQKQYFKMKNEVIKMLV